MGIQRQINRIQQNIENTYAVMEALGADIPEEQTSDNLSTTAGTAKPVLYKEQTLTEEEKAQARQNIGAAAEGEGGGSSVQTDWNQTDETKADYIRNKPDIGNIDLALNSIIAIQNKLIGGDGE